MTSHINISQSLSTKEEKKPELPFGCGYCKKRFSNSKELASHLVMHPEAREKALIN